MKFAPIIIAYLANVLRYYLSLLQEEILLCKAGEI